MKISFASLTGAGPRPINEDFLECWKAETGETVACIADGLGGMGGGDVAAQLAVNKLRAHLAEYGIDQETMIAGALAAHESIRSAQVSGPASRMASTLTAVALSENGIVGVHCGDSRAVIARGRGIKRLTTDHSEGQRLFDAGKITKEELAGYRRKHILESALGDREAPRIDAISFDLLAGDRVILTSDGVHNLVMLREMQRLCSAAPTPSIFIEEINHKIEQYGPTDNFSMIALFVDA